ncbi:hypothetical protein [Roseibium litorale]|uniref:Uncharacterized protein n=1 Tax=Roseibium litorale TaxID=2803841 RepID=A0ABR9CTN5_9HYPH|nr:hypothetical protein [Roseibium litorale]MBD8894202.1 hypothetical protein [Roseibium litorale]
MEMPGYFSMEINNAIKTAASDRGLHIEDKELALITRFTLERLEQSGLRIVPYKPTKQMQDAVARALDEGKRMSVRWVKARTKQRWRFQAALDAAPDWRVGYGLTIAAEDLLHHGPGKLPDGDPDLCLTQVHEDNNDSCSSAMTVPEETPDLTVRPELEKSGP